MIENRKMERFPLSVPVTVIVDTENGEKKTAAVVSRDLSSAGGYFLADSTDIPVGSKVRLELTLTIEKLKELLDAEEEVKIEVEGNVIRTCEDGFAVCFSKGYRFFPAGSVTMAEF
jgi:hypothetical protein